MSRIKDTYLNPISCDEAFVSNNSEYAHIILYIVHIGIFDREIT